MQTRSFLGQNNSKFNFQQLLFSWQCWKNRFLGHFCTTNKPILPLYRVKGREGSDLTTFEYWVFRPLKMVQKVIFPRSELNKNCCKLNFEWFWPRQVHFGMKTDDLRLGVRSDPSRPECVAATKIHQKIGEGGVTVKTLANKKRSESSFRKSQRNSEQSNRPFFNRLRPKNGGPIWPPAPNRVMFELL